MAAPGLPVIEIISCKLEGTTVVCSPGGRLLPKREKKQRPRRKEQVKPRSAPASKPKATTKSVPTKSRSTTGSSAPAPVPATDPDAAAAEQDPAETTEDGPVLRSCPPGHVVLAKANASGSFCEPIEAATPAKTDSGGAPPESGPGPEAKPAEITPAPPALPAEAPPAKVPTCCAAPAVQKSSGTPRPGDGNISICAASEEEARSSVATYADLTEYRLTGPVTCKAK